MRSGSRALLVVALAVVAECRAATLTVPAASDNALFEDDLSYSNGAGPFLYIGSIASGSPRRALMRFDVSAIPAGATITAASVAVTIAKAARLSSESDPGRLHRLTASWGEGASSTIGGTGTSATPQDATWRYRFYGNPPVGVPRVEWTVPGGDFVATPSAERNVGVNGRYVFASTPGLVADVQAWVNTPASNHGWILIGSEGTEFTARQVVSREGGTELTSPSLTVEYLPAGPGAQENDIPLPGWALALLGGSLAAALSRRRPVRVAAASRGRRP